jgi:hypothetical protein
MADQEEVEAPEVEAPAIPDDPEIDGYGEQHPEDE